MNCNLKIILILLIFVFIHKLNKTEGFYSEQEIKEKALDLYENKELFRPTSKFRTAKNRVTWIDPVTFTDAYILSLQNKFNISNLESIFR
jgi:hypothetical protein